MWTGERQKERERVPEGRFIEQKVLHYNVGMNVFPLSPLRNIHFQSSHNVM